MDVRFTECHKDLLGNEWLVKTSLTSGAEGKHPQLVVASLP